jgi:hypothetical protein
MKQCASDEAVRKNRHGRRELFGNRLLTMMAKLFKSRSISMILDVFTRATKLISILTSNRKDAMMGLVANKSILILEDQALIGDIIAETIFEAGGSPVGPILSSSEALRIINDDPEAHHAAVLDLWANGSSIAVAERLLALGIPFIFASGRKSDIPESLKHAPICEKPYTAHELLAALEAAFSTKSDTMV